MDNEILLTACAIIPGLMERRREEGYTDESMVHEAFRLATDYFLHNRKISDMAESDNSSASPVQQLKAEIADLNESIKLDSDLIINKINVSEKLRQLSAD